MVNIYSQLFHHIKFIPVRQKVFFDDSSLMKLVVVCKYSAVKYLITIFDQIQVISSDMKYE